MSEHTCPVCGYSGDAEFYPRDYRICGCCGTEFGYDDRVLTHEQLRAEWIQKGCPWFDREEPQPVGWDAYAQLRAAGLLQPVQATTATTTVMTIGRFVYGSRIKVRLNDESSDAELTLAF